MINIMYCGNDKAFDGMLISMISVAKHTSEPVTAYVLTMNLTDIDERFRPLTKEHAEFTERVLKRANAESRVILIDAGRQFRESMNDSVNMKTFYTPFAMLRLVSDKIENLPDKILYLDCDTVALKSIDSLYDIDVGGYEFAGVLDYLGRFFIAKDYVNSGVMLLNLPMIRQTGLFEKTRKLCVTKKMSFPDQSALNKVAIKKKFIDYKYNTQRKAKTETVIKHFCKTMFFVPYIHTENVKPWEIERLHSVLKVYYIDDIYDEYTKLMKEFGGKRNV